MSAPDPTDTYRQEAAELLEQLEQTLLDLEASPDAADLVDTAFRALHTIKGSGAMFGFDRVAAFTHHVETAFDLVRKGQLRASSKLIAIALAAKDQIRQLIEQPDTAAADDAEAILRELRDLTAATTPREAGPQRAASARPTWQLRFRLPPDAMAKGTNPLLLLDELRDLGPCTVRADSSSVPPIEGLDPTECHVGWEVTFTTEQRRSTIEQVFLFVRDDMQFELTQLEPDQAASPAATAAAPPQTARTETHNGPDTNGIRVPAARLDELMDRVGELVIAQSRLKQVAATSGDTQVKSVAEEIERLALELRDSTMGARMVPIGQLFSRFRRLVRDLSCELDKDIALITCGEDTELDKTLIDRLADPMIHLIRNAIDHGIEAPQQRLAAGKPAQGHITLTARHLGHEVLISITDDGKGLDRARILERAEETGLLPAGARPADSELFQLLFLPGFSTAREVTSLSGRGVGMDVVRRAIEALRGHIAITSSPNRATEITLHLPLTLAIIDGLLVRVGTGRYVIPLAAVEECAELTSADDARSHGHCFLNIRNSLVPFLRLRELFNVATEPEPYPKVVIVASGERRVGLVVDQVIGDHQTVIKSLSKLHANVATFSGATILGDGAVALILEVAHLVEHDQQHDRLQAVA